MIIEQRIPLLEEILSEWETVIGADFQGYKNHVYRVIHYCFALHECEADERDKIIIAGGFHDLGLWTEQTVDYLPPSVLLARAYLQNNNMQHWSAEIELIIDMHHKIRPYIGTVGPLVEVFRKADLADFFWGIIKGGIADGTIKAVQAAFPNAGFHKMLLKEQGKWLVKHPLNPFPILKW